MAKERFFCCCFPFCFLHICMFTDMHTPIYIAFLKDNYFHSEHKIQIVADEPSVLLKTKPLRDKDFCHHWFCTLWQCIEVWPLKRYQRNSDPYSLSWIIVPMSCVSRPLHGLCVHPSAATHVASVSQERIHGKFKPQASIWVMRIANGETPIEVETRVLF